MAIRSELLRQADEMRAWRRHLHKHPEIAYEERATADFVAGLLTDWGIDVDRGLAVTGVVGTLKAGSGERTIGLRADMDGLKIDEQNHFEHRSQVDGKMHACGHDGHMAMLLGAARYLARTRRFDGTIHFIFQPAEENEAGARRMICDGLFERFRVDAVYGMHNMPFLPEGQFALRPGPMMASSDLFEITVTGRGAHGAWPHTGIDPIAVACEIVLGFNRIVARTIDPLEAAVISVTQFNSGHASNVIPGTATLIGTTRTFNPTVRDHVEANMRQLCDGLAAAHGAQVKCAYDRRYPPTVNHPLETELAAEAAARVVGPDNVLRDKAPVMGAEDFAWMLLERPGSYIWIGNGPSHQGGCMLHNPGYDFNDRILSTGASYWVELAEGCLASNSMQSSGKS